MKEQNENSNLKAVSDQSKRFFANGNFNWTKNQPEVWSKLETQAFKNSAKIVFLKRASVWAVAATFLLLIGLTSFFRFYSVKIENPAGIHQVAELPDGSTVELNAKSTLQYYPFWWKLKRLVKFEGEGFFEVEKGKKFVVESAYGKTQVLGTSFNIFSRDDRYKVTCLSGKVRVTSNLKKEVILKPNSKVEITKDGAMTIKRDIKTYPEISWRNNVFLFSATPAGSVFKEIERQYGVKIQANIDNKLLYTGNFTKEQNVEDVLGYVCPALGLKFVKQSSELYAIIEETE